MVLINEETFILTSCVSFRFSLFDIIDQRISRDFHFIFHLYSNY